MYRLKFAAASLESMPKANFDCRIDINVVRSSRCKAFFARRPRDTYQVEHIPNHTITVECRATVCRFQGR